MTHPHRQLPLARPATLLHALIPAVLMLGSATAGAQAASEPRYANERLTYEVSVSRFGTIGRGSMTAGGPVVVRGTPTWALRFEFEARVGPVRVVNRTESWFDAVSGSALRFHKHEKHPLSTHDETVELFPATQRWEAADGTAGSSATSKPLDELSYIYVLRSLPLVVDSTYTLNRHFDDARNPTVIRVIGRETITTPAGSYGTLVVEMHVKDARRYKGDGVLRFWLSDDGDRVPVRMESKMPMVGSAILTLESRVRVVGNLAARTP